MLLAASALGVGGSVKRQEKPKGEAKRTGSTVAPQDVNSKPSDTKKSLVPLLLALSQWAKSINFRCSCARKDQQTDLKPSLAPAQGKEWRGGT